MLENGDEKLKRDYLETKKKTIVREMQWKKYDMTPLKSQISQMQAYFCSSNLDNAKFD